ncbi:hypothetical protein SAMN05920897_108102 [Alkalispirochaeta americana]|uniref:Lipopolysaccharide-assembly n=1 Tax=Alkalispirochaeta americana TaxID=159291 RepID=A0A1N6SIZ2_9SPIO|nr:hypothetical protein [Alkalispirochaeta americana]SIQ41029.1 hypothetical protein SAMN05920897_108102 [Alkalispirochaeta americana]
MSTRKGVRGRLLVALIFLAGALVLSSCETLSEMFQPTEIERVEYVPTAKPEWEGQTIYIDFEVASGIWRYNYASGLSQSIRDQLIEDVVSDGIFNVQDRRTGADYMFKTEVRIANPVIQVSDNDVIRSISATFRVRTYDRDDNLVTAKTREVRYDAPSFTVTVNDSQQKLVENYAYNAAQEIRQIVYESFE